MANHFPLHITIEGQRYVARDFTHHSPTAYFQQTTFHQQLFAFLQEWFSQQNTLTFYTSGSTGQPKAWHAEKQHMCNSAHLTCQFLDLKAGDRALLCLPLHYIAGKMMVVRSIVAELDLYPIQPNDNPLLNSTQPYQFAAFVPNQVYSILSDPNTNARLAHINHIIIGGSAINQDLYQQLATFDNAIYSSYGMTETLSHIALRRLNGALASDHYHPFPHVALLANDQHCLVIDAPSIGAHQLVTNDLVEFFDDGSFHIIGRRDNVINSGGVKIHIEALEDKLKPYLTMPFAIIAYPDDKFGEIVTLVIEKTDHPQPNLSQCPLSSYERPKQLVQIDKLPLTSTGKINRYQLKQQLPSLIPPSDK